MNPIKITNQGAINFREGNLTAQHFVSMSFSLPSPEVVSVVVGRVSGIDQLGTVQGSIFPTQS